MARTRASFTRATARAIVKSAVLRRPFIGKRREPVDGRTVDLEIAATLGLDDLSGTSDLRRCTPRQARARVAESIAACNDELSSDVSITDLEFQGPAGPLRARTYTPTDLAAPSPGIVYIHGGGFVTCDAETHDTFCCRLAAVGRVRVVSVEYRLAPENPYPAAADDAVAGFRWVASHENELGLDAKRLAVSGDSAGGNLSAVVGLRTRRDELRPFLQVPIYPALDATCALPSHTALGDKWFLTSPMIEWYYGHYFGPDIARRQEPEGSPLLAPDVGGLPAALVYTAGFDPLRDEGEAYAKRLIEQGVPARYTCFDSLIHGFVLITALSDAARAAADRIALETGEALRTGRI